MKSKPAVEVVQPKPIEGEYELWLSHQPSFAANDSVFDSDMAALKRFVDEGGALLQLPTNGTDRCNNNSDWTSRIKEKTQDARAAFLRIYAERVYSSLTDNFT